MGPLWYWGAFGKNALLHLLEDADAESGTADGSRSITLPGRIDATQIRGSHVIFLQCGAAAWL